MDREFDADVPRVEIHEKKIDARGPRATITAYDFFACSFAGQEIHDHRFESCSFRGCSFAGASLRDVHFWDCTFEDCAFQDAYLIHACFRKSRFLSVSFVETSAEVSIFAETSFRNLLWNRGSLTGVYFDHCILEQASFPESAINAVFRRCSINGECFRSILQEDSEIDIIPRAEGEPHLEAGDQTSDPLSDFLVSVSGLRWAQIEELDALLREEIDEAVFQRFLEKNREILAATQSLGHHGIYVMPQVPFGNKHRADFMIGRRNSMGCFWTGLEIESPRHSVVKSDGHFTSHVNHALDQVDDWRSYVRHNRTSVQQPRYLGGEGLAQIEPEFDVWIIIGRESPRDTTHARRERFVGSRGNTHVQTWDGFRDRLEQCLRRLGLGPR